MRINRAAVAAVPLAAFVGCIGLPVFAHGPGSRPAPSVVGLAEPSPRPTPVVVGFPIATPTPTPKPTGAVLGTTSPTLPPTDTE